MASKILLADDSITIQKVVNLTFADEGIDVITVSNGEIAERRLSEINPDLVLADIFMPGKNGYELCQFIKDTPPYQNIPVVLLVGAFEPFDQSEARRVKADGHLTKPFESRTLVETVRKLIQNSRSKSGSAKQSAAKQPQPIRDTRPLGPEPEQDAFIDVSQISGDGSHAAAQNGAPAPVISGESSAPAAATSADPLAVDYHGLWEMGAASGPATDSHAGNVTGDLSFGIDLGNGDAAHETQSSSPFPAGFEVTTPQSSQVDTQPAASGFEFGFSESPGDTPPEPSASQGAPGNESGQISIPPSDVNGSSEQITGFAVQSLFSGPGQDQVLDFKQVDAPEPPVPAKEVSFELSSAPVDSAEPALDLEPPAGMDGRYFDLIPQESAATTPSPAAPQWPDRPEAQSTESSGTVESGFDLAAPITATDQAPSIVEDEPLGDVFSEVKAPNVPVQETSFAIAEEVVTVDVRPPAGESFRMVLPPAGESEHSGAWPQLDPDPQPGAPASVSEAAGVAGDITGEIEAPVRSDFTSAVNPERSFAISEAGAVASPFDPRELRAGEPTEAAPAAPFQNEFRQEAAEGFTSSMMWAPEAQPAPPSVETQPGGDAVQVSPAREPALPSEWAVAPDVPSEPTAEEAQVDTISVSAEEPGLVQSSLGPVNGAAEAQSNMPSVPNIANLPTEAIDEIVRRVVREMSDAVVRELAWEILPDCVERVVERLSRESLAKKS